MPAGGLFLAMGVDVQGDRLEVEVDAYGEGEECWLVDHQVIHGDPSKRGPDSVWEELAKLREKSYPHAGGQTLRARAMAVDSGYLTQDCYDFCRRYAHRHVIATKGDAGAGKAVIGPPAWVDVNHRGQKIKRGVQAAPHRHRHVEGAAVQTSGARGARPGLSALSSRSARRVLRRRPTAEKLVRRRAKGARSAQWVKTRERNEALDLEDPLLRRGDLRRRAAGELAEGCGRPSTPSSATSSAPALRLNARRWSPRAPRRRNRRAGAASSGKRRGGAALERKAAPTGATRQEFHHRLALRRKPWRRRKSPTPIRIGWEVQRHARDAARRPRGTDAARALLAVRDPRDRAARSRGAA